MLCTMKRLVKLATLPGSGGVPVVCHASYDARVWMGSAGRHSMSKNRRGGQEEVSEEELDMDAVEAKLESLVNEEKRRSKTVKFHKIRRQMSDPGVPERRLSWDAIEQIRYLKQEAPQEWTVQRLAEGFSVSPDVISRILRSKFTPPPERRLKQDSKVLAEVRQLSLRDGQTSRSTKDQTKLPTPESTVPYMLFSDNPVELTALDRQALAPTGTETRLVTSGKDMTSLSRGTSQTYTALSVAQSMSQHQRNEKQEHMNVKEAQGSEEEEEQDWDRVYLTEEELEELVYTLHEKPGAVEQKGREFFDSEGNFLYRI